MTQPVHTPCQHCTMETRSECHSWEHLTVSPLIALRLSDALWGTGDRPSADVPRWVMELIADEFFADSPSFSRDLFLLRCGLSVTA
jgi:hypothetical protein